MALHSGTLTWDASTDAGSPGFQGYNVYRSETAGGETGPALNGGTPITALTFTDLTVVAGHTYFYVVTALANGLESVHSTEVSGTIPFSAPNPPTNVQLAVA